ncbi:hypothetical protein Ancab_021399 [Ancistrocladus abbreviatus]
MLLQSFWEFSNALGIQLANLHMKYIVGSIYGSWPVEVKVPTAQSREREREEEMGALTAAVIAVAGLVFGWIAIEMACKPCLERGREAMDRSLNPDYDPDDDQSIRAPLNADRHPSDSSSEASTLVKSV